MSALKDAITKAGGIGRASKACEVSPRAIYKWLASGCLPRTDYTGETNYAQRLAAAAAGEFTAEWLLAEAAPKKSAA